MVKLLQFKSNIPNSTQKYLAKEIGFSDSPIERYRKNLSMKKTSARKNSERPFVISFCEKSGKRDSANRGSSLNNSLIEFLFITDRPIF